MEVKTLARWNAPLAMLALATTVAACGYSYQEGTYFPQSWQANFVQVSECAETEHPAGGYQKVLATPRAAEQMKAKQFPIAEGEVVLKVQYKDDKTCNGDIDLWTVMRKGKKGLAPKSGDWEWQTVWGSGKIASKGQLKFCIDCHDGCAGEEYDFLCIASDL